MADSLFESPLTPCTCAARRGSAPVSGATRSGECRHGEWVSMMWCTPSRNRTWMHRAASSQKDLSSGRFCAIPFPAHGRL